MIPAMLAVLAVLVCALAFAAEPDDAVARAIEQHRKGQIVVHALPGTRVKVTQQEHEFWFGTAISARAFRPRFDQEDRRRYLDIVKENFNCAVHENALKWYHTERRRGRVSYEAADRMLAWCEESGIAMRGHCLFWAVDKYVQNWVKELADDELGEAVRRRATEVTSRYRGRIVEYDVNNEMVHGDFYAERLGPEIRVRMFQWAAEGDPGATLYVNDYKILSGEDVEEYARQIEWLIEQGAPVGGIGCQGHFWGPMDAEQVHASLDRLAEFGLPIRVTEFDLGTEDEQLKAQRLVEFYRTCFAHPAVTGVLMWGFWEGAHWRPEAALWKKDFSPTPAARAYRRLVFDKWWTRWEGETGPDGLCTVPAFHGRHLVEVGGEAREVKLRRSEGRVEVEFAAND
ncbi:MAG: endo-1,4-beta-xylanase [Candidatus Brocadiia bacterium]